MKSYLSMTSGNLRQWSTVSTIDMISSPCPFQRQTTLERKAWAIYLDQTALQGETTFLKYPPLFWKTKPRLHKIIPQIGEADATEKERRIDSSAIRGSSCCHWRCKGLVTNLISPTYHNFCYHPHCLPTNSHHIIINTIVAKNITFRWFSTSTRTANATKAGSNHF